MSRAAAILFAAAIATLAIVQAQTPAKPGKVDPKLDAFDSEVVGVEGLTIDLDATSVAYSELDYRIRQWQELITGDEALIKEIEASSISNAPSRIAGLKEDIETAKANIEILKRQKELIDTDPQCGNGSKVEKLDGLITMVRQQVSRMEPALAQMQSMDHMPSVPGTETIRQSMQTARSGLEAGIDRYKTLLTHLTSQRDIIDEACRQAKEDDKDDKPDDRFEQYKAKVDKANGVAAQRAAEAETMAAGGHFNELPQIREKLATVLEVSRANQLLGNEIGLEQQRAAVNVVETFARSAVNTCKNESANLRSVLEVERALEMNGSAIDLTSCLNRMMEVIVVADFLPFRMRHCGVAESGTWQFKVANDTATKMQGSATIDGNSGELNAAGTNNGPGVRPIPMTITGSIRVSDSEEKSGNVVFNTMRMMSLQLTRSAFVAVPAGGGLPTPYPAKSFSTQAAITIVNAKACDPGADVWSFK